MRVPLNRKFMNCTTIHSIDERLNETLFKPSIDCLFKKYDKNRFYLFERIFDTIQANEGNDYRGGQYESRQNIDVLFESKVTCIQII